jgi:glycosyltransferase involved in cell wall biosynthesis
VRALHVFPLFGAELTNGSERYEYMLSKTLVEQDVEVDVLTTTARSIRPSSAFSTAWGHDYPSGVQQSDGMRIHRFPVSFSMPAGLGRTISRLILRRFSRERRRYGHLLAGSPHLVDHLHRRALSRSRFYDVLMVLARGPHSAGLLASAARLMRRCDVVLVGFLPFALVWQVTRLAKTLGVPVVVLPLFHPTDDYHHFSVHYRALARADAVLAQTEYSARLFKELVPASNPAVVGAGVDVACHGPAESGERFREKYGLGRQKIVLFVGRKEASKRYVDAVEAVDLIDDDRVTLVMIGQDVDARPVRAAHARYLGAVSSQDLFDAYATCDVLVLPSEHESFGLVFLEAWAFGKPVIGNRLCGPVASVIRDGRDGYLCSDPGEIAERIVTLLADPSLARTLGEAGRQRVTAEHTWPTVARKVRAVYAEVGRGGSRSRGDAGAGGVSAVGAERQIVERDGQRPEV